MTITCTCPKCGQFCAFKDILAGHRVRCLECSERFIVPTEDGQKAKAIAAEPQKPLEGFFRAVLVDNFKVFVQPESLFGLILVVALTCFHFFAGDEDYSFTLGRFRPPLAIGWVVTFCCAGYLLWYFMEIINTTIMDNDLLPEIFIGGGFTFFGEAIKSIYLFFAAFGIAGVPGAAVGVMLENMGITYSWLKITIIILSFSMLPMILCLLGSGVVPWKVFRYDLIIYMIAKTFKPYFLICVITFAALFGVVKTVGLFADQANTNELMATAMLISRLGAVFLMLFAMRMLGLYVRHYARCFPKMFDSERYS